VDILEKNAAALAGDRQVLRKRLLEARATLAVPVRKVFGNGKFDFAGRRLIGNSGLVLQWLIREQPHLPVSYRNQQTNRGTVVLLRLKD